MALPMLQTFRGKEPFFKLAGGREELVIVPGAGDTGTIVLQRWFAEKEGLV